MLSLVQIFALNGYEPNGARVKIVRHAGDGQDMEQLAFEGWLEAYQRFQKTRVFDGCDAIISFVGEADKAARLLGVYEVGPSEDAGPTHLPLGCPHVEWIQGDHLHYNLTKKPGLEDLEQRVVIQWPGAGINWHQWLQNANPQVIEIRRPGRSLPPFKNYLRFDLSYRNLKAMADHEAAHKDWVTALTGVGGVYLIVDDVEGKQYVGSATGEGGIWGRWRQYANDGHGGNVLLQERCASPSGQWPRSFRYSVLETFSRSTSKGAALALEAFFKHKLGSRAFGLNGN